MDTHVSFKKTKWTVAAARAALDHTREASTAGIPIPGADNATFNQRALSKSQVTKYVDAYTSGKWHSETAEMVKLATWAGKHIILDGQHRLAAIVEHGSPVEIWTAYDVPLSAFPFFDQGSPRSANDILTSLGWQDAALFSTIGRLMYREAHANEPRHVKDDSRSTEAAIADYIGPLQPHLYALRECYAQDARKAVKAGIGAHKPGLLFSLFSAVGIDSEEATHVAEYLADTRGNIKPPHPVWTVWADMMSNPKDGLVTLVKQATELGHQATSNATLCNLVVSAFPVAWNYARDGGRRPSRARLEAMVRAALAGPWEGCR